MSIDLKQHIRAIPDFPKKGILFRDIGPLLRDPIAWEQVVKKIGNQCNTLNADLIVGIESRGFIVGASVALNQRLGFVPVRKPGKLPGKIIGIDYELEYGNDRLEIQADAFNDYCRVLIVDDLLATGGTAQATADLVKLAGGEVIGFSFIIELVKLSGRNLLPKNTPINSLINY